MQLRIRIARNFWTRPFGRIALFVLLGVVLVGAGSLLFIWYRLSKTIDARLEGQIFDNTSRIFAAPQLLVLGESTSPEALRTQLRRFGYAGPDEDRSPFGRYQVRENGIEIWPGPASLVGIGESVRLEVREGKLDRIISLRDSSSREVVWIDPPHITNLFDRSRTKRRLVEYADIPPHLIQAVLAAEDRRFFSHPGISLLDGLRALWVDIRKGAMVQGASTLNMQLARSFFLTRSRTWRRKAAEALIAIQLERRFSKEKIFELYANEIYLGQRGSFAVHGFGEAAQAYFGKDISRLDLPESAFLAGMIRGPSRYNPYRYPERALERRNYVLDAMVEIGGITAEEAEAAKKAQLEPAPFNPEASEAPYFIDLVRDQLLEHYPEEDLISQSYRIYTALDLPLQEVAAEAIREALPEVNAKIKERYRRQKNPPLPQIALIALDPHTGAVKALVGGRNYAESQLNRVVSHRQPGSSFKPFVYAAAFASALESVEEPITMVTTVVDEPTLFEFEGKVYEPSNYGEKFYGVVTVRDALIHSLNVATVKVAEMTGYQRVGDLAVAAGLNPRLRPTPSVALGAYDSTPLEVAGAYTVFANQGSRVEPYLVSSVVDGGGKLLEQHRRQPQPVLDPRVAYLVLDLMVDTLNRGTAAGARARGFSAPAAGKTGTSRDGWFAGFTSNLLCVVWVGFDDYRDLGLPGSAAALPIWTAFMKRAVALPVYRNVQFFSRPEGIAAVPLDPDTLQIATPDCPEVRTELFLLGTEPHEFCPKHRPSVVQQVTRSLSRSIGVLWRRPPEEGSSPSGEPPPPAPAPPEEKPLPPTGFSSPEGERRGGPLEGAAVLFEKSTTPGKPIPSKKRPPS